jgi:hypothetical protein
MNDSFIKELSKEWTGKRFVYRSKYGGEIIGTIKKVFSTTSFILDPASQHNHDEYIQTKTVKGNRQGEKPKYKKVEEKYYAYRPILNILSTNDQVYELAEIYIIDEIKNILCQN